MALSLADIQADFDDSPCIATLTSGQLDWLKVILLWKSISGDVPMTQDDIQTLFDESPCIATLTQGQIDELLALLISGGTGGTTLAFGAADPVVPPANPALASLYYNTTTKVLWVWDPDTAAWEA